MNKSKNIFFSFYIQMVYIPQSLSNTNVGFLGFLFVCFWSHYLSLGHKMFDLLILTVNLFCYFALYLYEPNISLLRYLSSSFTCSKNIIKQFSVLVILML